MNQPEHRERRGPGRQARGVINPTMSRDLEPPDEVFVVWCGGCGQPSDVVWDGNRPGVSDRKPCASCKTPPDKMRLSRYALVHSTSGIA